MLEEGGNVGAMCGGESQNSYLEVRGDFAFWRYGSRCSWDWRRTVGGGRWDEADVANERKTETRGDQFMISRPWSFGEKRSGAESGRRNRLEEGMTDERRLGFGDDEGGQGAKEKVDCGEGWEDGGGGMEVGHYRCILSLRPD